MKPPSLAWNNHLSLSQLIITTQSPRLVTSRLHEFHFHSWGWAEWNFLAFAARKRSTCLTWRVFIWGAVWLAFAVSGYDCKSLTLKAESIDSTLTKRMSNACKFLSHQKSKFVYFMLKLSQTKISGAFDCFPQIVTQFRISHGLKSIFYRFCNRPHVGISTPSHILLCLITCDWQFYSQESQRADYLSDWAL